MTASPELPRLHVITDDDVLCARDFAERAQSLLSACGSKIALHLRARTASGRLLFELASSLRAVEGVRIIVNDRLDVALTAGADGVQLRRESIPVTRARELLGGNRWIGYSAHSAAEAAQAARVGADYVIVGTIFPSVTHAHSAPAGVELITEVARSTEVPVIAIGGIDESCVRRCVAAGAWGVAVIRAIWSAIDPIVAAKALLAELEVHVP